MVHVFVNHTVADFDAWKSGYDAHASARQAHGCDSATVSRVVGTDTTDIAIDMTFPSVDAAQAFLSDPGLKEAMKNAGVQGAPDIKIAEQVETVQYAGAGA